MRFFLSTLLLFCFTVANLYCDIPHSNSIKAISVNPITGKMELSWTEALPSDDVVGYIIFKQISPTIVTEFDTVYGRTITMCELADEANDQFSYRVSPFNFSDGYALHTPPVRVFRTKGSYDVCSKTLSLSWTKPDTSIYAIDHLEVYAANPSLGVYEKITNLPSGTNNLQIETIFPDAEKVFCYVRAVAPDAVYANSLIDTILQERNPVPEKLYLRNLSVTDSNSIEVLYYVSNDAVFSELLVKTGNNIVGYLPFDNINPTIPIFINYADAEYQLAVSDSCGNIVKTSNSAKAIKLTAHKVNDEVNLSWSNYKGWNGGVDKYELYRNDGRQIQKIAEITAGSQNQHIDDLSTLSGAREVIYYVKGYENPNNQYGYQDTTLSNRARVMASEYVPVLFPTGFSPASTIDVNKLYKPIFTFIAGDEIDWHIYNSSGQIVFSGNTADAAWDGNINGKPAPTGQYVYVLQLKRSNKINNYKGSFSLLR